MTAKPLLTLALCAACVPPKDTDGDETAADEFGYTDTIGESDTDTTGESSDETSTDDTGDGDTGVDAPTWDSISCRYNESGLVNCYGQPSGSTAWNLLLSSCRLEEMILAGVFEEYDDPAWAADSCAGGETPASFFPMVRCGWLTTHGHSVCFAGDDEWLTSVRPTREQPAQALSAWPSWMCGGSAGDAGSPFPWDDLACGPDELTLCMGYFGNAASPVYPTCYIDELVEADQPDC